MPKQVRVFKNRFKDKYSKFGKIYETERASLTTVNGGCIDKSNESSYTVTLTVMLIYYSTSPECDQSISNTHVYMCHVLNSVQVKEEERRLEQIYYENIERRNVEWYKYRKSQIKTW